MPADKEPTEIGVAFGAAVKRRRLMLRLSQEDVAELAGLHRTYVSDVERADRNITLRSAAKIADALSMTLAQLLTYGE